MPEKPRRRRKQGVNKGVLAAVVVVLALAAVTGWYLYGPASANPSTSTSTSSSTSQTSASPVYAKIQTSLGTIEVQLFPNSTPKTVANFVSLAESGFYDNLVWHRIEPGFVIQTGDPNTRNGGGVRSQWGQGTSGTTIPFEDDPSLHNYAGYLGMASTGAGVGGSSQFYINLNDTNAASLDGKYAVFGKVIAGMDVVQALGSVPVEYVGTYPNGQDEPVTPVYVTSITILSSP